MSKVLAGKISDISPGKIIKIESSRGDILIANIDGEFFASADSCTHSGASLSEGKLEGSIITCGWHGAEFDCKSGKLIKFPAKINDLQTYNVIIEEDQIFVEV